MKLSSRQTPSSQNRWINGSRPFRIARRGMIRKSMMVILSTGTLAQATIIEFDLSPGGTGLSAENEVPLVAGSGTGNVISDGISFDTNTSTLSFVMGYGSAAGFTDLSGAATSMHIHGPAAAGANAPVLFSLTGASFPAAIPARGGIIYGSVVYPADKVAALLAGRNYVNIHTAAFPGGEIRGQLIPLLPPTVVCPASSTVECAVLTTYTAIVSDANGDAMQVVWTLNGVPIQTDQVAAGGPPSTAQVGFTGQLPLGINTLAVTATDSTGAVGICSFTIIVVDTTPPVILSASVNPKSLWPPNHKMVPVRVSAVVTDDCGPATWEIVSISSNESSKAVGSGNTARDWKITGDDTALVRAERSGKNKAGRIYTITLQATDGSGNKSAPARVNVTVAHDQGKNKGANPDDQPGDDQGPNPGGSQDEDESQDDDGQDDDWSPGYDKGKGKDKDKDKDNETVKETVKETERNPESHLKSPGTTGQRFSEICGLRPARTPFDPWSPPESDSGRVPKHGGFGIAGKKVLPGNPRQVRTNYRCSDQGLAGFACRTSTAPDSPERENQRGGPRNSFYRLPVQGGFSKKLPKS